MVLVELSGEVKELKFDFNAICAIEERTDKSIKLLMNEDVSNFNILRLLLWASLRHLHTKITLNDAGDHIQNWLEKGNSIETLGEKLMQALSESGIIDTGNKKEKESNNNDDLGE